MRSMTVFNYLLEATLFGSVLILLLRFNGFTKKC